MNKKNSQLPDLIYRDTQNKRLVEVRRCFQEKGLVIPGVLHRVTVFTTYRCNLRCHYCNTIRLNRNKASMEFDFPRFKRFVDSLTPQPVHFHFTGGEATLVNDLPRMIEYASTRDIASSLTTNGTAKPELYSRLIDMGLREIRISCDIHQPDKFDRIVGQKGAYLRVINTIRELVRLRDRENKEIFIIINMCIGNENVEQMTELVKDSIRLEPDDVKLMGISHDKKALWDYKHKDRHLNEINKELSAFPEERFPLLKKKLETVFARHAYGLEDRVAQGVMRNCFIPLTERIVDAEYYYPCPVYVREGGQPIGRLDEDDFSRQQEKVSAFSKEHTCTDDPICRDFCICCCKKFNLYANTMINRTISDKKGVRSPAAATARYDEAISSAEIQEMLGRIKAEREGFSRQMPYVPFMVIKPNGMPHKSLILDTISREGITIEKRIDVSDWNAIALRLYSFPLNEWRVYKGILLAKMLPVIEKSAKAEALVFKEMLSIQDLKNLKNRIREKLPPDHYLIHHKEEIVITTPGYVHTPDEDTYWIEANLIFNNTGGQDGYFTQTLSKWKRYFLHRF